VISKTPRSRRSAGSATMSSDLQRTMAAQIVILVIAAAFCRVAYGQGLLMDTGAIVRSGNTYAAFSQTYKQSIAWRNAMRTTRRSTCSAKRGNLCGSDSEQAALLLATAPQNFDTRSWGPGLPVLTPVKDQGDCGLW
jgi:hypothetical protein